MGLETPLEVAVSVEAFEISTLSSGDSRSSPKQKRVYLVATLALVAIIGTLLCITVNVFHSPTKTMNAPAVQNVPAIAATRPHNSTTQHNHTMPPHNTTSNHSNHTMLPHNDYYYYNTTQPHNTTTKRNHTMPPHNTTPQRNHTMPPHNDYYYYTTQPHNLTTLHNHTMPPHNTTTQSNLTTLCPDSFRAVFADMHDGDKKEVIVDGKSMTIQPSGDNQTWVVKTEWNTDSCSAIIDFNVTGKPGPPPVNLTATLLLAATSLLLPGNKPTCTQMAELEFTDPSGTLAAKTVPLNHWAYLSGTELLSKSANWRCQEFFYRDMIFKDMHDGDLKEIIIDGDGGLIIKPVGNLQRWIVRTELDTHSCSAVIDFNVSHKPSPPPVKLLATFLLETFTGSTTGSRLAVGFTDPSGTLAAKDFPLNRWVHMPQKTQPEIVV